jgi:cell division transport system permease protein
MADLWFSAREAVQGIRRSGLLAAAAVVVMSLSFLMLGLFLLLTVNLRYAVHLAQERVEIAAYAEEGLSAETLVAIGDSLRALPGVRAVQWVGKDAALERFTHELGEDAALLESLEANPLPASYEMSLYDDYKTSARVQDLTRRAASIRGIEDVDSGQAWVDRLNRAIAVVAVLDLGFGLVVVFATVVSIGSTIQLALLARRDTVQVLRLVGASWWFIRSPFLIEGLLEGGVAAGLAALLLFGSYRFAVQFLPDLKFLSMPALAAFLALGASLGGLGALVAVRGLLREGEGCA